MKFYKLCKSKTCINPLRLEHLTEGYYINLQNVQQVYFQRKHASTMTEEMYYYYVSLKGNGIQSVELTMTEEEFENLMNLLDKKLINNE